MTKIALLMAFAAALSAGSMAELPPVVTQAPHIDFTESHAELRKLIPGLGELQPDIGDDATAVKERVRFLRQEFSLKYGFQQDRFYGWSCMANEITHEAAIRVADQLVPLLEKRFGPAARTVILPDEADGLPLQMTTSFAWKVNGHALTCQMRHDPESAQIILGSQRLGGSGGDILQITRTGAEVRAEVVSHHGARGEFHLIEGPTNEREMFVLLELARRGVTGTLSNHPLVPPDYGQEIAASGGRNLKEMTYSLDGFRVRFPITVFRRLANDSRVAEVHFGMGSLFPAGLSFDGETIDLERYEDWRHEVPRPR